MQLKIEMYDVKDEMIFDTEEIFAHEIIQEVDGYYCVPVVFEILDEDENEVEEGDEDEDTISTYSSDTDLSDIFNEDAIAGMVVGFVAGAAVVGGGVLLHKLLK